MYLSVSCVTSVSIFRCLSCAWCDGTLVKNHLYWGKGMPYECDVKRAVFFCNLQKCVRFAVLKYGNTPHGKHWSDHMGLICMILPINTCSYYCKVLSNKFVNRVPLPLMSSWSPRTTSNHYLYFQSLHLLQIIKACWWKIQYCTECNVLYQSSNTKLTSFPSTLHDATVIVMDNDGVQTQNNNT